MTAIKGNTVSGKADIEAVDTRQTLVEAARRLVELDDEKNLAVDARSEAGKEFQKLIDESQFPWPISVRLKNGMMVQIKKDSIYGVKISEPSWELTEPL